MVIETIAAIIAIRKNSDTYLITAIIIIAIHIA